MEEQESFLIIAANPNQKSSLPYLISLPVAGEGPVFLATSDTWPLRKDLYCHPVSEWPQNADIVDKLPIKACWRQGKAVHLILRRRQHRRSMFVWTKNRRGRTLIFWRTPTSMRAARPGIRVPKARALSRPMTVAVDTREQYPWTFSRHNAEITRCELPVGDYGLFKGDELVAAVERKSSQDLATSAVSGTLTFILQELSTLPYAAVVIEGRLSDLIKNDNVRPGWLLNLIAALQIQFPRIAWIFAETRKLAEDYAYRWLAAAKKSLEGLPGNTAEGKENSSPALGVPGDLYERRAAAAGLAWQGKTWTTQTYAEWFEVSRSTALNDLKALVEMGVLKVEGNGRNRHYILAQDKDQSKPVS